MKEAALATSPTNTVKHRNSTPSHKERPVHPQENTKKNPERGKGNMACGLSFSLFPARRRGFQGRLGPFHHPCCPRLTVGNSSREKYKILCQWYETCEVSYVVLVINLSCLLARMCVRACFLVPGARTHTDTTNARAPAPVRAWTPAPPFFPHHPPPLPSRCSCLIPCWLFSRLSPARSPLLAAPSLAFSGSRVVPFLLAGLALDHTLLAIPSIPRSRDPAAAFPSTLAAAFPFPHFSSLVRVREEVGPWPWLGRRRDRLAPDAPLPVIVPCHVSRRCPPPPPTTTTTAPLPFPQPCRAVSRAASRPSALP